MYAKSTRTLQKVYGSLKAFLRRNLWLKVIVVVVLLLYVLYYIREYKISVIIQGPPRTLYEYYEIKPNGPNEGLTANDPTVFKLNGKNITITSGTIHYFRVHPAVWRDRLRKLRAMGALAVETYVPWNLHEPKKDVYDFGEGKNEMSKFLDIVSFIKMAREEDLLVILRPGPYICAEWDFGGLPSYLIKLKAKIRTSDPVYMQRVELYFSKLLPLVEPLQVYKGGPIIMFQVENEYGALHDVDHIYMIKLKEIMVRYGIQGLFFTADSPIPSADSGSLADENVLQTANFKQDGMAQLGTLKQLQPSKPLMVMEFWTGWFDHWDEPIHNVWDPMDYAAVLKEILQYPASVNLYVFHGGTTFGFYNGANIDVGMPGTFHPDTSSYDYDALLAENGDYTAKYELTRKMFMKLYQGMNLLHPEPPPVTPRTLTKGIFLHKELTWPNLIRQLPKGQTIVDVPNFIHSEDLDVNNGNGQSFGYTLYRHRIMVNKKNPIMKLQGRIRDIIIVFVDGIRQTEVLNDPTQLHNFGFWGSKEESIELQAGIGVHTVEYLVENCGRINYVKSLFDVDGRKGLGPQNKVTFTGAVMEKSINITALDFSAEWVNSLDSWTDGVRFGEKDAPTFYKSTFVLKEGKITDTYFDVRDWKKGVVFVNGFNIGRYFSGGPQLTLYIPAPLLHPGVNTIIIFEHYSNPDGIQLIKEPIFI